MCMKVSPIKPGRTNIAESLWLSNLMAAAAEMVNNLSFGILLSSCAVVTPGHLTNKTIHSVAFLGINEVAPI